MEPGGRPLQEDSIVCEGPLVRLHVLPESRNADAVVPPSAVHSGILQVSQGRVGGSILGPLIFGME